MQDNAPSIVSKHSLGWLEDWGFSADQLMQWPANSSNLNLIENLWSILKMKIFEIGCQYCPKDDLWKAIEAAVNGISTSTIKNLTDSMDRRLIKVIENQGGHIKH